MCLLCWCTLTLRVYWCSPDEMMMLVRCLGGRHASLIWCTIHPYVAIRYVLSGWEIMLLNMSKDRQSNKSWRVFMCTRSVFFLGHHFETMFEIKREKLRITIVRRHIRSWMNYMFINLNISLYLVSKNISKFWFKNKLFSWCNEKNGIFKTITKTLIKQKVFIKQNHVNYYLILKYLS